MIQAMAYVDHPLVRSLIESGLAEPSPVSVSSAFDQYLSTLPWHPTSLDWSRMPPWSRFRLTPSNEEDAIAWACEMAIGRSSHVTVVYAPNEPGLRCTLDTAIRNLGPLFAAAPGKNFLFASNRVADDWQQRFMDLMEFDGGELLTAVRAPIDNSIDNA